MDSFLVWNFWMVAIVVVVAVVVTVTTIWVRRRLRIERSGESAHPLK